MTRTLIRPWFPDPHSASEIMRRRSTSARGTADQVGPEPPEVISGPAVSCPQCRDGLRHAFLCRLVPEEGPAWEVTVHAIGPRDARNLAFEAVRDEPFDPRVTSVIHAPAPAPAPALDDEEDEEPDAVDEWKAWRDAGLAESELRYLGGDR